jgi:hypothetical protein
MGEGKFLAVQMGSERVSKSCILGCDAVPDLVNSLRDFALLKMQCWVVEVRIGGVVE